MNFPTTFPLDDDFHCLATDSASDGVLDAFFPAYDKSFVLENEKEERSGFVDCLSLNHGLEYSRLSNEFGPFREVVLAVRNNGTGGVVAGANFLMGHQYCPERGLKDDSFTLNLNYLFVVPEMRGQRLAERVISAVTKVASATACNVSITDLPPDCPRPEIFLEVNDPFKLSAQQYAEDSAHAGIDQFARLNFWKRLSTRIIDFPYLQPPLSGEQAPDATLALAILFCDAKAIPRSLLHRHLARFFGISVLKGMPLSTSEEACLQIQTLQVSETGISSPLRMLALPEPTVWEPFQQDAARRQAYGSLVMALSSLDKRYLA